MTNKILLRFLVLSVCFYLFISCASGQNGFYSINMVQNLKFMYENDQFLQQWDKEKEGRIEYRDSMVNELDKVCRHNTNVVKKYFEIRGYPGLKQSGKDAQKYFWLIVQHSDHDVKFQSDVAKALKILINDNNGSTRNYAFLCDRVNKNLGKPQLYGTQIEWLNGVPIPYTLENEKEVNKMRLDMGLEPIEEYLNKFKH